jgi:AbiJ N-terminal domain 4
MEPVAIVVREDAPEEFRGALLQIATGEIGLSPSFVRDVLCTVLRRLPDPGNWSDPNVWYECQTIMMDCPWFRVYDFIEAMYRDLAESREPERAATWEAEVNDTLLEKGIGWKMSAGLIETRGTASFESLVKGACDGLADAQLPTAGQEMREAIQDLSRRPSPDLTGAIHHAMAALECTARHAVGDPKATLGEILKKNPDMVPRPLDVALEKAWGYASEKARHVREGRVPNREEAELIVGLAAAVSTYLASKT